MGFIKEVYSNNRAGLVVAFGRGETSNNYFSGDSVEEAMKHFNLYLKGHEIYAKTEDEKAIENLGIKTEDASEFRSTVNAIITTLTDEQAIAAPILFPVWQANAKYKVGDRIRYEGKLYKVIQDHNSQIGWEPISAASLFASLLTDTENGKILDWMQPDSTNGYSLNDKVTHNNIFWISTIDNNVWEPGTINAPWQEYIATWKSGVVYAFNQKVSYNEVIYISLVAENSAALTDETAWAIYIEKEEEDENENQVLEWEQPDSSNAYSIGDHVYFNGAIYESLIDNNVWSPEAYPAGWSLITE